MKNLIIISGDLASGKSTLSKKLGERLSYIVLNKDPLKEIACDVFDYSSREENKKLSKCAMDNMVYMFKKTAEAGYNIILEANFRSEDICNIAEIVEEYDYNVVLLFLKADSNVSYERFLSRLENRHKAHISIGLQYDFNMFVEYNEMLRNQDLVYEQHTIDTTYIDEDMVLEETMNILMEEEIIE